ncbi:MAG: hypothetical protein QG615_1756 [Nitrospirota bacterium]|nr:hypothetical protein [Nitrospirota bacterium]
MGDLHEFVFVFDEAVAIPSAIIEATDAMVISSEDKFIASGCPIEECGS